MIVTRRQFAAALAAAGAASAQAAVDPPESPESLAHAVADDLAKSVAEIRKLEIAVETEPAFAFSAQ